MDRKNPVAAVRGTWADMEAADDLHRKLKALLPNHQLGPDAVFVAILRHDKKSTDQLQQADALWVKCPRNKLVSAVRKAYSLHLPGEGNLVLLHGLNVVPNTASIGSLDVRGDNLVVLEAIRESDLSSRTFATQTMKNEAQPVAFAQALQGSVKMELQSTIPSESSTTPSDDYVSYLTRTHSTPSDEYESDVSGPHSSESSEYERVPPSAPQIALETENLVPDFPIAARLNILELFKDSSPEQLEKGLKKGVEILTELKKTLEACGGVEHEQWLGSIANVEKQAVRTKTVVGVVGATGAGKSSVINAMMDEERLVPTNCMRACTAVVTEISYNHEDDTPYKAEIEFITKDDWHKELKVLFKDLLDGSGQVSRECAIEDSDAGIAYAKIRACYPHLTKETMAEATVESLMSHANVTCLGSTRSIEDDDSSRFYKKLQHYVDSKEKAGSKAEKEKEKKEKRKREMEFWPLIRVVRLYVKAPALSTGAVIVDLPGVHDSNQARAAVAQGYLKQCTGLWIVAPITRAVDDKSAKTLLGETFKRQLKMDGGYNSVTFICSKTDDISLTEASDSLGLDEELGELWDELDAFDKRKRSLKKEIEQLKETKSDFSAAMETMDEELEKWEKLQDDAQAGKTVYAPKAKKKRKHSQSEKSRKKSKYAEESDDDFIEDSDSEEESEDDVQEDRGDPLNEENIIDKIADLRSSKKHGRREKAQIEDNIKTARSQVEDIDSKCEAINAKLSALCIAGRNDYSRDAIRADFSAGIKELDQELAEEEDAANFNPDIDSRDYEEVARSLPVFCVSSRGYQKLMGRLQKDPVVPGFKHLNETEIPQLQQHCLKLTEAGRQAACRRFLNSLSQLLNSLRLWSSSNGTSHSLTDAQLGKEAEVMDQRLKKLDRDLETAVKNVSTSVTNEFQDHIYESFTTAVAAAQNVAMAKVRSWGAPINHTDRDQGGLHWCTYRAIVRRDGVYTNARGLHDFNEQLTEPVIRHVATGWERTFTRRVPSVLGGLHITTTELLKAFHHQIQTRALHNGVSIAPFQMLEDQLAVYSQTVKDISMVARNRFQERQRDINREFTPVVTAHMLSAYYECANEAGPGTYQRMRWNMERHVEVERRSMFDESVRTAQASLTKLVKEGEEILLSKLDEVYDSIKRDYTSVILGRNAAENAGTLQREARRVRQDVLDIAENVEQEFKRLVGLLDEEVDSKEEQVKQESQAEVGPMVASREATGEDILDTLSRSNEATRTDAPLTSTAALTSAQLDGVADSANDMDTVKQSAPPQHDIENVGDVEAAEENADTTLSTVGDDSFEQSGLTGDSPAASAETPGTDAGEFPGHDKMELPLYAGTTAAEAETV